TYHLGASAADIAPADRMTLDFVFPALNLGTGSYSVTAALHTGDSHIAMNFDWWDHALVFQVVPGRRPTSVGTVALDVTAQWLDAERKPVEALTRIESNATFRDAH